MRAHTVGNFLHVPAVRLVPELDILSKGKVGLACVHDGGKSQKDAIDTAALSMSIRTIDGDEVVIVKDDQVAQAKVAGDGRSLRGNTLLEATITAEHEDVVVDDGVLLLVVAGGQVPLGNRHAHAIRETCLARSSVVCS
jgi:hypothetical protein